MKLIKMVETKNYNITLLETGQNEFQIIYKILNQECTSEKINNFEAVTLLFDLKLEELERAAGTIITNH